jgi:acylphosphatase
MSDIEIHGMVQKALFRRSVRCSADDRSVNGRDGDLDRGLRDGSGDGLNTFETDGDD